MNKEQFLAMSLPYGLKCYFDGNSFDIIGIFKTVRLSYKPFGNISVSVNNCKPILHPLSDLTKDEWIEKLNTFACNLLDAAHVYDEKNVIGLNLMTHPFEVVMWLIEHHFDIAGLIEKGEAIDVNTLPENPYSF